MARWFNDTSDVLSIDDDLDSTIAFVHKGGMAFLSPIAVVLQTRKRVHDLGVFKAVGMTPRQAIAMAMNTIEERTDRTAP